MSCMRMVHVEDRAISNWHWTMPSTMELTQPACHGRVSLPQAEATRVPHLRMPSGSDVSGCCKSYAQLQQKMDWMP